MEKKNQNNVMQKERKHWKIKLVNNVDLKKATWVIKTADYFFHIIPNCIT